MCEVCICIGARHLKIALQLFCYLSANFLLLFCYFSSTFPLLFGYFSSTLLLLSRYSSGCSASRWRVWYLHWIKLHYTALHCLTLPCPALHYPALHWMERHWTVQHCTALHSTAHNCTSLHSTSKHHPVCCAALFCSTNKGWDDLEDGDTIRGRSHMTSATRGGVSQFLISSDNF